MKHIKLILVLGILASGAIGAERATAGTCQTTSSSFPFFLSCNFRSEGYGYTDSGTKAVAAFLNRVLKKGPESGSTGAVYSDLTA